MGFGSDSVSRPDRPLSDGLGGWQRAIMVYRVGCNARWRSATAHLVAYSLGLKAPAMWPEAEKTEELLAGAREGDASAVNRLLDRHREALRKMVDLRIDPGLERRVDASDVVQDVMMEANQRLNDYLHNPVMPFHLWLRQLAKDRIIDLYRRHRVAAKRSINREQPLTRGHRLDQSTLDLAAQICDREMTPAEAATWHELQRRFRLAVHEMDEPDREVIMMRHFEQLSNSEVAQALSLTEPAAGMRYLRAMRRLRERLADPDDQVAGE